MPLVKDTLQTGLVELFEDPPDTAAGCAQAWANAVADYTTAIFPTSTTVSVASNTLFSALTVTFQTSLDAAITAAQMELAFAAFATTVGTGMAGYTATPPAGQVGFLTLFGTPESTVESAAIKFADAIDAWIRTGTATLIASPFTTVNWS